MQSESAYFKQCFLAGYSGCLVESKDGSSRLFCHFALGMVHSTREVQLKDGNWNTVTLTKPVKCNMTHLCAKPFCAREKKVQSPDYMFNLIYLMTPLVFFSKKDIVLQGKERWCCQQSFYWHGSQHIQHVALLTFALVTFKGCFSYSMTIPVHFLRNCRTLCRRSYLYPRRARKH